MSAQQNNSNNSTSSTLDLLVIGGGINGAGIAADASGRGLNVGLYEANDFASARIMLMQQWNGIMLTLKANKQMYCCAT